MSPLGDFPLGSPHVGPVVQPPWADSIHATILRGAIRKVLDANYGPMSYNAEVTESILRAVGADAEFEPMFSPHPYTCDWCKGEWFDWNLYDQHFGGLTVTDANHPTVNPRTTRDAELTASDREYIDRFAAMSAREKRRELVDVLAYDPTEGETDPSYLAHAFAMKFGLREKLSYEMAMRLEAALTEFLGAAL